MEIFNIQIFGETIEYFCSLSDTDKKKWIKSNTNQSNDVLIEEFLQSNYKKSYSICVKCGVLDNKFIPNGNFSKTDVNEVTDTKPAESGGNGKRNSAKRPKKTERGKD